MRVQAHLGRIETNASALRRSQVCIDEAIPLDDAVDLDVGPAREHRPGRDERLELAVLPVRILGAHSSQVGARVDYPGPTRTTCGALSTWSTERARGQPPSLTRPSSLRPPHGAPDDRRSARIPRTGGELSSASPRRAAPRRQRWRPSIGRPQSIGTGTRPEGNAGPSAGGRLKATRSEALPSTRPARRIPGCVPWAGG